MPKVSLADLRDQGVLDFGDGYRTKRSEHGSPGFRILRVADVSCGRVHLDGPDFVRNEFARSIGSKLSEPGDVLLTTKGTVGRVSVYAEGMEQVVYSPQLCYFRTFDRAVVEPRFLAYWLSSESFIEQAGHRANNTDMAAYINLRDIASLTIDLPPIGVQRATAEVLGSLDDKIAANGNIEQRTRQLLTAHFEALETDIVPTRDSYPLDTLIDINPRTALPMQDEAAYLDMKNLPDRALTVRSWSQRAAKGGARFQNGDTLVARITPCLENGKVGYADFLREGEVGVGSTEFIVLRSRPEVPSTLPYFFATSERFREHAIRHMSGTSGRQRLAAADVGAYPVQPPSPEALGRFGELTSSLVPMLRRLVDQSERLAATRDELLPLLMSSKVRVSDADQVVTSRH